MVKGALCREIIFEWLWKKIGNSIYPKSVGIRFTVLEKPKVPFLAMMDTISNKYVAFSKNPSAKI